MLAEKKKGEGRMRGRRRGRKRGRRRGRSDEGIIVLKHFFI